jgi:alkylation response protein AidB-like acyl-CoA dehydrogenase
MDTATVGDQVQASDAAQSEARLDALIEALQSTAAERDRAGGHAAHEKQLVREAGLLTLAVPREYGGRGARWQTVFGTLRRIARVDSALGHLFGFQCLQVASVALWGDAQQRRRYLGGTAGSHWWWGNAINPLDTRLVARPAPDGGYLFTGVKGFCSGTRGSDMMLVSACEAGTGTVVVAVIPTGRHGVAVQDDWTPIGQRQTDSGSVRFDRVAVAASEVLPRAQHERAPIGTLRTLIAQLVLVNLFTGIAEGALAHAADYATTQGRRRPGFSTAADDPHLLRRFGEMRVQVAAARALTIQACDALGQAWDCGPALSAQTRADVALAVSEAKVVAHRAALEISQSLFDVCGARAAADASLALDRFWRNARTHTLHDSLDERIDALGRHTLTGQPPAPSVYM